jgi:hypothetical protein
MIESKYLKKEDVGEEGTIVTIASFERVNVAMENEPPEYKWTMRFEEFDKPMVLNSTNINLCEQIFDSDNTDDWQGKKIIVYNEPNISFGNKLVGGIRIRAHRKAAPPREMAGRSARNGPTTHGDPDDLSGDPPF